MPRSSVPGVRTRGLRDRRRRTGRDDLAATVTRLGAHVDDPVGLGHHVEIVLDHHHGVARVHEAMQHVDEFFHVRHVQADGGFVEHVQRVLLLLPRRAPFLAAHLGELGHELDALRLAAGQRGTRLAEREIPQAHVLQQPQRVMDGGVRREEFDRVIDVHG